MKFRYSASGPEGDALTGFVEADDEAAARDQLQARGIQPDSVEAVADESPATEASSASGDRLSSAEQTEAIGQIESLVSAGVPLSAGLRTLAEEIPSKRLCGVFRSMSDELDQGRPLDEVLENQSETLPPWLAAIVSTGTETGRLAESVQHYVRFARLRTAQNGQLALCLTYPALLVIISAVLAGFVLVWITPMFREIFFGFGVELPGITMSLIAVSDVAVELTHNLVVWVPALAAIVTLILVVTRRIVGASGFRRLLYEVPVAGRMLKLVALSEFCHLLALLVENRTPLPKAFELVSVTMRDPHLSLGAAEAAIELSRGTPVTRLASHVPEFPSELLRVSGWETGERELADSLRAASDVFTIQSEVSSTALAGFMGPLAVMVVGSGMGLFVIAMFMPLVKLLNDLS